MKIRRLLAILLTLMLVMPGGIAESPALTEGDIAAVTANDAEGEPTDDKTDAEQDATEADEPAKASLSEGGGATAPEGVVPFSQSALCDGVIVTVRADAGTFPASAMLSVTKVLLDEQGLAEAAVDEVRDDDQNVAARYTFDIRVLDAEGVELQPAEGRTVQVSFAMAEVADENLETNVYHIADDMTAEKLDVTAEDATTAVVETEGFSLYTVELTYNTLQYVLEGGAFALSGGSIAGNTAVANGGGVFVSAATFGMTGGAIENNLAQDDSGGVYAGECSAFDMTGGRIAGNAAGSGGGGVFVFGMEDAGGAFTLSGGAITGNTAAWGGGGVYVDVDARFALSGAPDISGNTRDGSGADNVYLYRDSLITVAGKLTCAAPIGVTTLAKPDSEDGFVTLTDGLKESGGDIALFKSDDDGCALGWNDAGTEAVLGLAIKHAATGYEGVYDGAAHGITVAVTAPDSGYEVKYGTEEGQYTLDGSPTYTDAGAHTVCYKVSARGYCDVAGSATVNIAKAPLTVTADAKSKVETEPDPALTYTVTGLIGGDRLTGALARAAGELPGTYAITQGTLAASANYALTFTGAALTIRNRPEIVVPGDIPLLPVAVTVGPTSMTLGWTPLPGADGYDVFFARCGKKSVYQMIASVPAGAQNDCSITGLKTGTAYKCYVMAWRIENGVKTYIDRASPTVHAIAGGENKDYCNAKEVTVQKAALTVKVGGRRRIRANVRGVAKGKKVLKHARKLRYYSSDRSIAVVDGRGRVKGISPGTCTVCVVANNGMRRDVTVTVK